MAGAVWGRMDTYICMAESPHWSSETITLLAGYSSIQNKKFTATERYVWFSEQWMCIVSPQWRLAMMVTVTLISCRLCSLVHIFFYYSLHLGKEIILYRDVLGTKYVKHLSQWARHPMNGHRYCNDASVYWWRTHLPMQETWVWSLSHEDPPRVGNGNLLQYSCLGNSMDWGAWRAKVHGLQKSQT